LPIVAAMIAIDMTAVIDSGRRERRELRFVPPCYPSSPVTQNAPKNLNDSATCEREISGARFLVSILGGPLSTCERLPPRCPGECGRVRRCDAGASLWSAHGLYPLRIVGVDARPNWKERSGREGLTGVR
jgi:hypothetical protein